MADYILGGGIADSAPDETPVQAASAEVAGETPALLSMAAGQLTSMYGSKTLAQAKALPGNALAFPTDSKNIVFAGKEYGNESEVEELIKNTSYVLQGISRLTESSTQGQIKDAFASIIDKFGTFDKWVYQMGNFGGNCFEVYGSNDVLRPVSYYINPVLKEIIFQIMGIGTYNHGIITSIKLNYSNESALTIINESFAPKMGMLMTKGLVINYDKFIRGDDLTDLFQLNSWLSIVNAVMSQRLGTVCDYDSGNGLMHGGNVAIAGSSDLILSFDSVFLSGTFTRYFFWFQNGNGDSIVLTDKKAVEL